MRPYPETAVKDMTREQYREWAAWFNRSVFALAHRLGLRR